MTTIWVLAGGFGVVAAIVSFFVGRRRGSSAASAAHLLELNRLQSDSQETRSRLEKDIALSSQALDLVTGRGKELERRIQTLEAQVTEESGKLAVSQVALSAAKAKGGETERQLEEASRDRHDLAQLLVKDQVLLREQAEALGRIPGLE